MGAVQCFDLNRPHHERVIGRLHHRLTTLLGAAEKDPLPVGVRYLFNIWAILLDIV